MFEVELLGHSFNIHVNMFFSNTPALCKLQKILAIATSDFFFTLPPSLGHMLFSCQS